MTLGPGRTDTLSVDGPWARDLYADLDVIRAWRPAMVISLLEPHELKLLGVSQMPSVLEAIRRIDGPYWYQMPIRDGGTPDAASEETWSTLGASIRSRLLAGSGFCFIVGRGSVGRE